MVSALGRGGYHLGTVESEREAVRIVQSAIDAGITFTENAWEYHDGRSETLTGKAIADRRLGPDSSVLARALRDHAVDARPES